MSDRQVIFAITEDRELISQTLRGNESAYNRLVSLWDTRIFNYIFRRVSDREDAQDLTQIVFLKAYQRLATLQDISRFAAWLYRIAHNESCSLLRQLRSDRERGVAYEAHSVGPNTASLFPVELALTVQSALKRLSDEQREVIVLRIYCGFKFDEMAETLACPVSTVKSRLYTALDLLNEVLTQKPKARSAHRCCTTGA
jgi:RNA polymerase sigma-70 factor (ECF subfamily)